MKKAKFDKAIRSTPEIPTLPAVAARVLYVVRDPHSSAKDLEQIVRYDPVLASQVMRLVNSAYFGLREEVTDLRRAIVLAGFNTIRNLAFTVCLRSLYRPEYRCGAFTGRALWLHSVSVAVIARMLAARAWLDLREEAFLAGIVHDVGIIVEWNLLPGLFGKAVRLFEDTGLAFREAEKRALGFSHTACGASIMRRWGLPKYLIRVARRHHDAGTKRHNLGAAAIDSFEGNVTLGERLAAVVHLAECVCAERGQGFFDQPRDHDHTADLLEAVDCDREGYREIVEQADQELERARDILAL